LAIQLNESRQNYYLIKASLLLNTRILISSAFTQSWSIVSLREGGTIS